MALLRLYQGEIENAISSITHALKETKNPRNRSGILAAYIEIMLSAGEVQSARDALSDMKEISHEINAQYIHAQVFYAEGGVLLAEEEPQKALDMLQHAKNTWEQLKVPYEVARTQCLIGKACFETGDPDTGLLELRTARWTFQRLKAIPDLTGIDSLMRTKKAGKSNPLSPREQEVLRHIANGKTNKSIAEDLFISERTVERHVSNIFNKLNVSSRSEATAYAYQHRLI
jgi:ATP/maltotriose-dependent transcriptional regulator MalT